MAMTNQEKFNKAQDRIRCMLDKKQCELSKMVLDKISLINSISSIEFKAINKKANNEINEYEALLLQKDEAERCLEALIDEINISGAVINAMSIGIKKIKEGEVDFEVKFEDDNDPVDSEKEESEAYSNKVSSKKKRMFGR